MVSLPGVEVGSTIEYAVRETQKDQPLFSGSSAFSSSERIDEITLSNGAAIIEEFTSKASFAGFWITDPEVTITGISLKPLDATYAVSATNMYFGYAGVPAPGAFALLGIATLFASSRRRAVNR